MSAPVAPQPHARTAITYLRVSTRQQAAGGDGDEGFSIPAQRVANARKATELDAAIVAEFVDAGESAKSANRPELQRLLAYVAQHRVDYCIVHKVDRLARNRVDDAVIHLALRQAGVTLVSATENIDETPSGMLTHGIMSTIAEFYSLNLAAEVTKGLVQKAQQGGTPAKAPIGYLNVRAKDAQGREVRTVQVDPERAPLIQWAFAEYASGQTTVIDLQKALTARGLTSVPSPQRGGRPLAKATLYKVLTNPYYLGMVRWNGAEYPGTHEPLIDRETWDRVQSLLKARGNDSSRHVKHDHYLKGVLYCGVYRSRMILDFPTNRHGTTYAYFICRGRASRRTPCTRRAVRVHVAEALVEQVYASIRITDDTYRRLAEQIDRAYDERVASRAAEFADLAAHRAQLDAEADKLLRAHFADAIDLSTLKRHQDRIRTSLADIDRRLAEGRDAYTAERSHLRMALELLRDWRRAYKNSSPDLRRIANAAFFERIYLTAEGQPVPQPTAAFADFIDTDEGSTKNTRVDLPRRFSNKRPALQALISRVLKGSEGHGMRSLFPGRYDTRGPVAKNPAKSQTRLSPHKRSELVAAYQAGEPVRSIALRFGVHRGTVSEFVRQAAVPARHSGLDAAGRAHAAALYESGLTLAQVAAELPASVETVRSAVLAEGGTIRPKGRMPRHHKNSSRGVTILTATSPHERPYV